MVLERLDGQALHQSQVIVWLQRSVLLVTILFVNLITILFFLITFIAIIENHLCDCYFHDGHLNYHPASLAHQVGMVSSPQNLGQDHFVSGKGVTYFFLSQVMQSLHSR